MVSVQTNPAVLDAISAGLSRGPASRASALKLQCVHHLLRAKRSFTHCMAPSHRHMQSGWHKEAGGMAASMHSKHVHVGGKACSMTSWGVACAGVP